MLCAGTEKDNIRGPSKLSRDERRSYVYNISLLDIHEHPVNAELYIYASIRADLDRVPVACGAISSCSVHTILSSMSSPGLRRASGRSGCLGAGER
ncbi:hypothetical protein B0H17DRAFT_1190489 [Mycena rosella]|uniref:Uncharacterized protein n=1 Tax=Mycena rosella TaxID=1033263 RepID=A0AAD7H380_MYCRO|nr:hypothetical protein B0H17DRAFT_1190489 [Mycena rosella]